MSELTPLKLDDYDAIAAAVEETERGRWFLSEYARRNRTADTEQVLDALAAIEKRLAAPQAQEAGPDAQIERAIATVRALRDAEGGVSPINLIETEHLLTRALNAFRNGADDARASRVDHPRLTLSSPKPEDDIAWIDVERVVEQPLDREAAPIPPDEFLAAEAPEPATPEPAAGAIEEPAVNGTMNGQATLPARPKLPAAHTPLLLDGLSEAERAILFA